MRQRQRGVFRTNCIDCLDRTNVVQGLLARHHLEAVLHRLRILPADQNLPNYFPAVSSAPSAMLEAPSADFMKSCVPACIEAELHRLRILPEE